MADSGTYTPETLARRLAMAQQLLGDRKQPIRHWAEGLDELAKGYFGGKMFADAENSQKEGDAKSREFIASLLGGGSPAAAHNPAAIGPQSAAPSPVQIVPENQLNSIDAMADLKPDTQAMLPKAQGAISSIESGGRYDAQGPVIQSGSMSGQRAIGKYQIMESNIGPWTKEVLGRPMTPHEFAASPDAQDAVFNAKFGKYAEKYGSPEAASRAWFAGEGGMNNAGARDQLGTTVANYGSRFNQGMQGDAIPAGARPTQAIASSLSSSPMDPMKAKIVEALRSKDPYISRAAQGMAGNLLQKQFAGEAPTNDIKEYNLAKQQGFPGTLVDYQTKLKEAGKPVTNINQQQESEYQKSTGKHFADLNNQIATGALKARGEVATINRLGQLLNDPNVYQGKGAETVLEVKRLAKAIGIDVGDLGGAEAIRSIQNQYALELRNPSGGAGMPGAMSDKDREFLQSIPPGLERTKEGNQLIADYRKKVAERSIDVDRLRQQYVKKNGRLDEGFYQELAKFSDANPLFAETNTAPAGAAPTGGLPAGWSVKVQ